MAIGLLILAITPLRPTVVTIGVMVAHGLAVGLAWDEIATPGGLQLGARIQ